MIYAGGCVEVWFLFF